MRIVATHRIESQHAEVLAWHERPGALVRLTPPGVATIDDPTAGGMRAGRVVGAHMGPTALPLRPAWVLRHTDADPSGRFVDQQVSGPWRTWRHEHTIAPDPADPAASRLTDAIEIELPAGLERNAPVRAALERRVQRLLAFRARQVRDDLALHAGLAAIGPRTVAITGSSGLVGTQLAALLESGGHTVRCMVREDRVGPGEISWDPRDGTLDPADLEGVDAVVHLGGRSIATRWTAGARREIRESRVQSTALIARTLARMADGPRTLVTASAIGVYGARRPGELLTEADTAGTGFLADLVRDWEAAAAPAARAGLRVTAVRTGVVLSDGGGSLLPQLPLYLAGAGGRLAPADAVVSWITLDDLVRAYARLTLGSVLEGPVNAVAPHPVTQQEFAGTLGRVLHRPALLPVPAAGPSLLLGREATEELILADQRVSDARLRSAGVRADHPVLTGALRHVLWR